MLPRPARLKEAVLTRWHPSPKVIADYILQLLLCEESRAVVFVHVRPFLHILLNHLEKGVETRRLVL